MLLSDDLTAESRVMIYRDDRPARAAGSPRSLRFDRDPYLVVTDDGRLVWMLDGYTTTDRYPYSEPVRGIGNYIRNAVKATVDAYDGSDRRSTSPTPTIPIIRTYAKAFPGLFRPLAEMPKDLQAHIRYPEDLFAVQARMYATYHMEDPQVFYNKEDLWAVPRRPRTAATGDGPVLHGHAAARRAPRRSSSCSRLFNPSGRDNMIALARRALRCPELRPAHLLQLPEAEAGLRAAQYRRADQPGSR